MVNPLQKVRYWYLFVFYLLGTKSGFPIKMLQTLTKLSQKSYTSGNHSYNLFRDNFYTTTEPRLVMSTSALTLAAGICDQQSMRKNLPARIKRHIVCRKITNGYHSIIKLTLINNNINSKLKHEKTRQCLCLQ